MYIYFFFFNKSLKKNIYNKSSKKYIYNSIEKKKIYIINYIIL